QHCDMTSGLCVQGNPPSDAAGDGMMGEIGCSDGTREALRNRTTFPTIAACDGAWDRSGVVSASDGIHCNRQAGNTGTNAGGVNCNVADLCAAGWHVCNDLNDVASHDGAAACSDLMSVAVTI